MFSGLKAYIQRFHRDERGFLGALMSLGTRAGMSGIGGAAASGLAGALTGGLGAAVPFLASSIFGNIFKSKQKKLQEEQLGLMNDRVRMANQRDSMMSPYIGQLLRSGMGRLPDHMQGAMNPFIPRGARPDQLPDTFQRRER